MPTVFVYNGHVMSIVVLTNISQDFRSSGGSLKIEESSLWIIKYGRIQLHRELREYVDQKMALAMLVFNYVKVKCMQ